MVLLFLMEEKKMRTRLLIIILLVSIFPVNAKSNSFNWGITWINSPNADGIESDQGYELARATGITLEHRQYLWGDIEKSRGKYNWFILDHWINSLKPRDMKVSISIGPINTLDYNVPSDLSDLPLDSDEMIDRYVSFLQILVSRYKIDYLAFSNEPNLYYRELENNNTSIKVKSQESNNSKFVKSKVSNSGEFHRFTQATYTKIKNLPEFTNVQIIGIFALTFIYDGKLTEDSFSINFTQDSSDSYDIFGISTYDGITNRPDTDLIIQKLKDYLLLSYTTKWAIVETGVNAVNFEDLEYQIDYMNAITEFTLKSGSNFIFLAWLNLFDYPSGFLEASKFENTGLFTINGDPKPIVKVFAEGDYYNLEYQLFDNPTNKIFIQLILFSFSITIIIVITKYIKKRRKGINI